MKIIKTIFNLTKLMLLSSIISFAIVISLLYTFKGYKTKYSSYTFNEFIDELSLLKIQCNLCKRKIL